MASEQEARSLNGEIKLGKHIGNSTKSLLHELLRFTNGRVFTKAIAAERPRSVVFRILGSDRILIEYNDDGLTKADLEAIRWPASEEQLKASNFKEIFIACKKVHIQSGNFSFEFQHNILDLTDSTISPVWVSSAEIAPINLTRITLHLHDQGSKEDVENLRKIIHHQFEELHDATLLFLKELEFMRIEFCDMNDKIHRSKSWKKENVDEYRVLVTVTSIGQGKVSTDSQLYHLTEQPLDHLATSIILAFPLTDDFKPRADDTIVRKLFNFVPLRTWSYGFHVHSDFSIQDERHDMATASLAQMFRLSDQFATAFCQAILQFLEHPTLCYHWSLFLAPRGILPDPFGVTLDTSVRLCKAQNPILGSRKPKHWRLISHLAFLGSDFEDSDKKPLLEDPMNDAFLSPEYPPTVALELKKYGLAALTSTQFLHLLEMDLRSPNSKMHTETSKDWQNAVARLLSKTFTHDGYSRMKSLPLIQLTDGSWTSITSGPVYFSTAGNVCIPEALDLRVASHLASREPEQRSLYQQLGVFQATVIQVRQMILDCFKSSSTLSLEDVQSYLHYLYLTHQSFDPDSEHPYQEVRVFTMDMKLQCPQNTVIYLSGTGDPYSLESFLDPALLVANLQNNFLHPEISNNGPKQPSLFHPSWKSWLCKCVGIRERLSLSGPKSVAKSKSTKDDSSAADENGLLSTSLEFVSKHRPDKFLGVLEHLWALEGPAILKSPALVLKIKSFPSPTLCNVESSQELQETWVPSKHLRSCVSNFMEHPNEFPLLKLDEERDVDLALTSKWGFLTKHFGVKWKYDMSFLLEILKSIRRHSGTILSSSQIEKVLALYAAIGARFRLSTTDEKEQALDFFNDSAILYIDDQGPAWTGSSSCLWAAPPDMVSADSLKVFYEKMSYDEQQLTVLTDLFHNELNIQNATAEDLVQELSILRDEGCEDVTRVAGIYKYLNQMTESSDIIRRIKRGFEDCELILVKQNDFTEWFSASDCFWSEANTTELSSSLKQCYPDLKDFFLDKVGIKISAYDELLNTTSNEPHAIKMAVFSFMHEVGELIPRFPAKPIQTAKIFPVRYPDGTVSLCSVETEFAIADRENLRRELEEKVKILDFNLKESRCLWPFFEWLEIEDRYLSRCVKELVTISPNDSSLLHGSKICDLRRKSYHITRVASTFGTYGPCGDAAMLFQRLKTLRVVEFSSMSSTLEMTQDEEIVRSTPKPTIAHVSDYNINFTIYVPKDKKAQQLCLFSVLPRILEKWLRQDVYTRHTSEVVSALTSIIASDVSVLDEILEDQGIIELPFERHDLDDTQISSIGKSTRKIVVKLPGEDERKTLVLRERESASEVANRDASV
ncbi:uncharacterized protein BKA55DRAFT_737541 [Fusarium redolens]|uniref:Uncharacterized protein n=1 Tax=Fusarium redolens TaxID=48865 RepID=A0A9P9KA77_FUSRE|nr:uncharacterized protein BKA55DRAFT_737541 [Fusarium redolens]KAH7253783.1 hypothetical protein BKA55DRAFT_737541 [Fusarium redolens]